MPLWFPWPPWPPWPPWSFGFALWNLLLFVYCCPLLSLPSARLDFVPGFVWEFPLSSWPLSLGSLQVCAFGPFILAAQFLGYPPFSGWYVWSLAMSCCLPLVLSHYVGWLTLTWPPVPLALIPVSCPITTPPWWLPSYLLCPNVSLHNSQALPSSDGHGFLVVLKVSLSLEIGVLVVPDELAVCHLALLS